MKIRTTWRRTAAVLTAGALVLTACNGEDEPEEPAGEEEPADDGEDDGEDDGDAGGAVEIGEGVTEEPCPDAVNEDNGCIYLGTLSDLSEGPFAALGGPITEAQVGFWKAVNEAGGIGGAYDVNVTEYVRDNKYNPETHNQLYQEIKDEILAIAQTLGSPTTAAIVEDMAASQIVGAPASWTSALEFQNVVLESGNNYCAEISNGLDYYTEQGEAPANILSIHYPGDYGWDGAAGAKKWAEANDVGFTAFEQAPGGPTEGAISQILSADPQPEVVVLTVAPGETAAIVGGAAAQGFTGRFIGNSPTWNVALLATPAADALKALYWQAAPWGPYGADTPGHQTMRDTLGLEPPVSDAYTAGWVWSYPLREALEQAYAAGSLTREAVAEAAAGLSSVDYEGMLPDAAGATVGNAEVFTQTVIAAPDAEAPSGVTVAQEFYEGPTVAGFGFEQPCFVEEGFAG